MSPLTMATVTAAPVAHSSTPIPQTKPGINPMVYVGTLGVFLGAGIST